MKILITGSNGLLGQKLVNLISNTTNHTLIATAKGDNRLSKTKGYIYESMDITNSTEIFAVFEKHKPDILIHGAAMTNVDQCETEKDLCWNLNVNAVEYLVSACTSHNTHMIHVSTDFIFDGSDGPLKEDAIPNPISFYGWSKYAAEKLVENSGLSWSIARTILVYGLAEDMSRSNIILWVKKSLEEGKTIKVVNDQWRTPTLAEDLAQGCLLLAESRQTGIFNIGGAEMLNPYQMAIVTADFFSLDKSLIQEVDGSVFKQTAKRPLKTGLDITKAVEVLNYKPTSFTDGISILAKQIKN